MSILRKVSHKKARKYEQICKEQGINYYIKENLIKAMNPQEDTDHENIYIRWDHRSTGL